MAGPSEPRPFFLSRLLGARRGHTGGDRLVVRVRRSRHGSVLRLEAALQVPPGRWADVANAFAAVVAEVAATHGALGRVGIVAGEPPILAVFRPRRDVVAGQVRDALTAGASHRRPHLWLALPDGTYLAEAVDPDLPFAASSESVAAIVARGRAVHALLAEARPDRRGVALTLALYSSPGGVRSSLRVARRLLAALPGWTRASSAKQATPSAALKTRLHR
jgi:hypothetical protein